MLTTVELLYFHGISELLQEAGIGQISEKFDMIAGTEANFRKFNELLTDWEIITDSSKTEHLDSLSYRASSSVTDFELLFPTNKMQTLGIMRVAYMIDCWLELQKKCREESLLLDQMIDRIADENISNLRFPPL